MTRLFRSVHWRRLLLLAVLVLVVTALLTLSITPRSNRRFWRLLFDATHLPTFVAIGFAAISTLRTRRWPQIAACALAVALMSAATEAAQLPSPRDASVTDALANVFGGSLGIALGWSWLGNGERRPAYPRLVIILGALAVALTLGGFGPAARELAALRHIRTSFPVMGDFEDPLELVWWQPLPGTLMERTDTWAAHGTHSLEITPAGGNYPGAGIEERAFDWSAWDSLTFSVRNPGDSVRVIVRVDDDGRSEQMEDRYTGRFDVPHGVTRLAVPMEEIAAGPAKRRLRLHRIRRFLIFTNATHGGQIIHLDDVRLVKTGAGAGP